MDGQMNIFDFLECIPKKNENSDEYHIREELLRGSCFSGGKKRIYEYFKNESNSNKRVEFLKKEYGIGGGSRPYGLVDYNSNGIDLKYDNPIVECTSYHIGWKMAEKEIQKLIYSNLYYHPPICQFSNHSCNKEELWKVADSLSDKDDCPHVCCMNCKVTMCGARCNGSKEPKN